MRPERRFDPGHDACCDCSVKQPEGGNRELADMNTSFGNGRCAGGRLMCVRWLLGISLVIGCPNEANERKSQNRRY